MVKVFENGTSYNIGVICSIRQVKGGRWAIIIGTVVPPNFNREEGDNEPHTLATSNLVEVCFSEDQLKKIKDYTNSGKNRDLIGRFIIFDENNFDVIIADGEFINWNPGDNNCKTIRTGASGVTCSKEITTID